MVASKEKGSGSIKASVDLVVLHVTVTDDRGNLFRDLTKGDFRVSENKAEQRFRFSGATMSLSPWAW